MPKCIRSDNGPEFVAQAIKDWTAMLNVETLDIEPGAPLSLLANSARRQNGYAGMRSRNAYLQVVLA